MSKPTIHHKLSDDYTHLPGGRLVSQGDYSGEHWYNNYLLPLFEQAINGYKTLVLDFDDIAGTSTGFLDEAFGRLVDNYGSLVPLNIEIVCSDDPYLKDEVMDIIEDHLVFRGE